MSEKKNGGPAFPRTPAWSPMLSANKPVECTQSQEGMTLRDWFAGQALAGIASRSCDHIDGINNDKAIASLAYKIADAMLAASKSPKQQ